MCDDTYSKNCQISFLEETENVNVTVCYTEANRVCRAEDFSKRKRSLVLTDDFKIHDVCIDVYETGNPCTQINWMDLCLYCWPNTILAILTFVGILRPNFFHKFELTVTKINTFLVVMVIPKFTAMHAEKNDSHEYYWRCSVYQNIA